MTHWHEIPQNMTFPQYPDTHYLPWKMINFGISFGEDTQSRDPVSRTSVTYDKVPVQNKDLDIAALQRRSWRDHWSRHYPGRNDNQSIKQSKEKNLTSLSLWKCLKTQEHVLLVCHLYIVYLMFTSVTEIVCHLYFISKSYFACVGLFKFTEIRTYIVTYKLWESVRYLIRKMDHIITFT